MIDYRIVQTEGFTEKIGELVSMLSHTRDVTLADLEGLSKEELDYLPSPGGNSIGALLLHIAAIEVAYQVITFENRDLNEQELQIWGAALDLGEQARETIKGKPLDYYLEVLSDVRTKSLALLSVCKDSWLFEEGKWENGVRYNNYWRWFHVMEDELNHRGQIRSIKRLQTK
ncbi:hypothetical protein A8F94_16080 [Bacillus sp. FJAT-27225]|uniref:DinB family protein n=1 Tax=Bacillus sp. FJAT-27225 TaxID=1743144 RepID=UPI00080C33E7|nr:DinB family protein [Bacillus sp. FJAT-27225]OCA84233.1 hypothetical protein A8F94_16080 [Bacillus sp. FJAT-27225]